MNKRILLIIPILAALFVFIGAQRTHYYPFTQSIELDEGNVLDAVNNDKGLAAVYERKILFATPRKELIRIKSTDINGIQSEARAVFSDGNHVYAIVGDLSAEQFNFPEGDGIVINTMM
jgi:hypothetical protein